MIGLQVANLGVKFDREIIHDVSFTAPPGQVTALVGPNGAGKSTLLSAIAGLIPHTGQLLFDATDLDAMKTKERARLIAFVPQDTALTISFTAEEVVAMGRYPHRQRWAPESEADKAMTRAALEHVGATHLAEQQVNQLSGGQRQLIHIARAVAQDTPVVLLDEPVSALDLKHQVAVLELLGKLAAQGKAIVVVLHDLNLVARWCDRAVLLSGGQIQGEGPISTVFTQQNLECVYDIPLAVEHSATSNSLVITPKPVEAQS